MWLGLEQLHQLSSMGDLQMRVSMGSSTHPWSGWGQLENVQIADDTNGFQLIFGARSGGNSNADFQEMPFFEKGQQFTTRDHDVDQKASSNCAVTLGGWWHKGAGGSYCTYNAFNGNFNGGILYVVGGSPITMDFAEIKVRLA